MQLARYDNVKAVWYSLAVYNPVMLAKVQDIWTFINDINHLQKAEAVLVILGIPLAVIKWIFFRPRLALKFIPSETYHNIITVPQNKRSLWLHLMCFNNGFVEAKDAKAYITKVYEFNKATRECIENKNFRSQIALKWAHEPDYLPKNILPRSKRRLDVCYALANDTTLLFSTEYYPSGSQRALPPGNYIFEVIVTGSNVDWPARYYFHVDWDGIWEHLKFHKVELKDFKIYKASPAIQSFKLYNSQIIRKLCKPEVKEKTSSEASTEMGHITTMPSQAPDMTD